ncbi:hypothetical protein SISNIDRAFT_490792 [Sistotremastrum niveocremeum HHB9708]|uniref:F-box domain-containing protein n=1 Tax=Sistotremastrum niveocremeum HHB9708 TaxID=1314777 RepID=A0A164NG80_9AGAM|nr:hypothetical protein SISNIDRAFT_490792 [Sistotremastrum niveocremeum HHB9708]
MVVAFESCSTVLSLNSPHFPEEMKLAIAAHVRDDTVTSSDELISLASVDKTWRRITLPLIWACTTIKWGQSWRSNFVRRLEFIGSLAESVRILRISSPKQPETQIEDGCVDMVPYMVACMSKMARLNSLIVESEAEHEVECDPFIINLITLVFPALSFPQLRDCRFFIGRSVGIQTVICPRISEFLLRHVGITILTLEIRSQCTFPMIHQGLMDVYIKTFAQLPLLEHLHTHPFIALSPACLKTIPTLHLNGPERYIDHFLNWPRDVSAFTNIHSLDLASTEYTMTHATLVKFGTLLPNLKHIMAIRVPTALTSLLYDATKAKLEMTGLSGCLSRLEVLRILLVDQFSVTVKAEHIQDTLKLYRRYIPRLEQVLIYADGSYYGQGNQSLYPDDQISCIGCAFRVKQDGCYGKGVIIPTRIESIRWDDIETKIDLTNNDG